jgi:ribosomal protein S18 acetylase RimI-like enzyme
MPSLKALAQQRGFQRLILLGGVYISNVQAIRFYEKQGFENVGSFDPGEHKERRFDMMLTLA